jgi:hypothetical protein
MFDGGGCLIYSSSAYIAHCTRVNNDDIVLKNNGIGFAPGSPFPYLSSYTYKEQQWNTTFDANIRDYDPVNGA